MASFKFQCPQCGSIIESQEELIGQQSTCPYCRQPIVIRTPPPLFPPGNGALPAYHPAPYSTSPGKSKGRSVFYSVLIVIGIVLIIWQLAYMGFNKLTENKVQAERIRCTNNLKQLGLYLDMHRIDNNDHYPSSLSQLDGVADFITFCPNSQKDYIYRVEGLNHITGEMLSEKEPVLYCDSCRKGVKKDGSFSEIDPVAVKQNFRDIPWLAENNTEKLGGVAEFSADTETPSKAKGDIEISCYIVNSSSRKKAIPDVDAAILMHYNEKIYSEFASFRNSVNRLNNSYDEYIQLKKMNESGHAISDKFDEISDLQMLVIENQTLFLTALASAVNNSLEFDIRNGRRTLKGIPNGKYLLLISVKHSEEINIFWFKRIDVQGNTTTIECTNDSSSIIMDSSIFTLLP